MEIGFDGLAGELVKVAREGFCEVHAQVPQRLARRIRACAIMSHAERTPGRLGRHSIRMVEELCGATNIAKEHDGVPDGTLRLMRLHPVHVPAVYLLPLIFRGHAEALVPLLPAELACCEFAKGQTPLVVLVRAAVVVGVHRLKFLLTKRTV